MTAMHRSQTGGWGGGGAVVGASVVIGAFVVVGAALVVGASVVGASVVLASRKVKNMKIVIRSFFALKIKIFVLS